MSRTKGVWLVVIVGLAFVFGALRCSAQDAAKPQAEAAEKPTNAYRLDFSVNELEEGRKINSRQYSLDLNSGDLNVVKIGTRVPMELKGQMQLQYLDVGTSIKCRVLEKENGLLLVVWSDISNFAIADRDNPGTQTHPLVRQLQINASTIVALGKPVVIGSVDDPNSKRQYQLEVTATKLR